MVVPTRDIVWSNKVQNGSLWTAWAIFLIVRAYKLIVRVMSLGKKRYNVVTMEKLYWLPRTSVTAIREVVAVTLLQLMTLLPLSSVYSAPGGKGEHLAQSVLIQLGVIPPPPLSGWVLSGRCSRLVELFVKGGSSLGVPLKRLCHL
jgi:hypothetical protein